MTQRRSRLGAATAALVLPLVLAACGNSGNGLSGSVKADGSSTVGPLTSVAAELYQEEQPDVKVSVGTAGTGGGFEKFCKGEIDISDASRPIKDAEKQACDKAGVKYAELLIANDALTIAVPKDNNFLDCLTTEQLKQIWDQGSTVKRWNQVDPSFPNTEIKLYGPGTDSGTFDYFTAEINGEEGRSRTDYTPSEDDNVLVQGVSKDKNALGYFGYTYFEENQDKLKAVKIGAGQGCVVPSVKTAQEGKYQPLARPLFIYVSEKSLDREEVTDFIDFYIENIDEIVKEAKYIPLTSEQKKTLSDEFAQITK